MGPHVTVQSAPGALLRQAVPEMVATYLSVRSYSGDRGSVCLRTRHWLLHTPMRLSLRKFHGPLCAIDTNRAGRV